jgi:hypothetical protein
LQAAARSFRELADNLDKRSAGLIIDGCRTLADISRAVNNFDRNPTRVLFGAGQRMRHRPQRLRHRRVTRATPAPGSGKALHFVPRVGEVVFETFAKSLHVVPAQAGPVFKGDAGGKGALSRRIRR